MMNDKLSSAKVFKAPREQACQYNSKNTHTTYESFNFSNLYGLSLIQVYPKSQ